MLGVRGKPNDQRGFVHKRIFRGIGGLLTGGPLGGIAGFLSGGRKAPPELAPVASGCPPGFAFVNGQCVPIVKQQAAASQLVSGGGGCPPGLRRDPETGQCLAPFSPRGVEAFGEAQVGRFGAGLVPMIREGVTRVCPRGAVLGVDGLCYNRRDLRNSERFWPRGRRPLLTGGEMRCIGIASAAAKKLQRKQKQLEAMGMLKKPARRAAPKLLAAGHHAHVAHD